jgi:hypothetical protein
VRADWGRENGEGGGIVTVLVGGADLGGCGSCLMWSQLQQLLPAEDTGDVGEVLSAGADVGGQETLEAEEAADAAEAMEAAEAVETGRLPSNLNWVLVPVGSGLMSTGESVLRKSR